MAKLAVFGLFCSSKIVFAQDATTEAATEEPTQPFFAEFNRQALLFSNGCFCQHGASCDAQNCLCINFYTGTNCQNAPSCSSSNPCLNGGSCMDTCTQPSGIETSGQECVDGTNHYECTCINNLHGQHCDEHNACFTDTTHTTESGICKNGGVCTASADSVFECTCQAGWTGDTCEDQLYSTTAPCNYNANKITVNGVTSHCLNSGICVNSPNTPYCTDESCCQDPHFTCTCENGYHGSRCQNEKPCDRNSGFGDCKTDNSQTDSCINGINGAHTCTCNNGYSGDLCEIEPACLSTISDSWCLQNVKIAGSSYCKNSATCVDSISGVKLSCQCDGFYTGKSCEIPPTCVSNAGICENGGSCTDISSTSYTCDCINGYSGNNCQIAPPCNQSPCNTGNTDECQNLNGNAICVCKPGFNGALCQNTIADSTDECINFPFEIKCNGCDQGACVTCSDNHHGKYCQFSSPCDANPCQNSGTCTQLADGEYTCACVGHHHGKSCQLTPACQGAPCQNSGICSNLDDGDFTCACENSWSGKICDEHADLVHTCQADPCSNSGTWDGNSCTCINFYHGERCELAPACNTSPCTGACIDQPGGDYICAEWCADQLPCSDPNNGQTACGANGVCNNVDSTTFECMCTNFYSGNLCETKPPCETDNNCNPGNSQCQNIITADSSPASTCNCLNYYSGVLCNDPPKCDADPCENGATCLNKHNSGSGYECQCVGGYMGANCDILPCDASPCQNSADCYNLNNGAFACDCQENYEGTYCETYTAPPCQSGPCQNDGVCTNLGSEFYCDCSDTLYYGQNCENYAACKDPNVGKDQCLNGADCLNLGTVLGDGFMCECAQYYYGVLCSYYSVACDPNPCVNGGVCHIDTTDPDKQWCACAEGWKGSICQESEFATSAVTTATPDEDHTFNDGVLSAIIIGSVVTALIAITMIYKFIIYPKFNGNYDMNNARQD